jgi:hypothetical protein
LSVGSAESDPEKQLSITELMDLADKTMYEQKKLKQSSAS